MMKNIYKKLVKILILKVIRKLNTNNKIREKNIDQNI